MAGDMVDQPFVRVGLTKWNTSTNKRDTIASLYKSIPDMMMAWDTFTLNLTYNDGVNGTSMADSAIIMFSSSGKKPVDKSYLYVDNIAFSDIASGVEELNNTITNVSVFPNPTVNDVAISFSSEDASPYKVQLLDIHGRVVQERVLAGQIGEHSCPLHVAGMPKGVYLVKISGKESTQSKKLVIQ